MIARALVVTLLWFALFSATVEQIVTGQAAETWPWLLLALVACAAATVRLVIAAANSLQKVGL